MDFERDENRLFLNAQDGTCLAEVAFLKQDGVWVLEHTYVSPELRGQNIGEKLMLAAAKCARDKGAKIRLLCPYSIKWFGKNKEDYIDILEQL